MYYCEINIYVTAVPKKKAGESAPAHTLKRSQKKYSEAFTKPTFTADQLYGAFSSS